MQHVRKLVVFALVSCHADDTPPPPDPVPPDPACAPELLATPGVTATYYVAIGEPGADNTLCDGRAPTDEGNGRCPFRDLDALVAHGLTTAKATRIELRAGTYPVVEFGGFELAGSGASANEPLVLSAYADEKPVLDIAIPDSDTCTEDNLPPGCVRQVVKVEGRFVVVQGLTVQNGLAYDIEVAGSDHTIRCNRFTHTRPFGMHSDMMKLYAANTRVEHNEYSNWASQAIDMAGATGGGIVIEANDFHDPSDLGCGATGIKLGAHGIAVRNNTIHDITSPHCISPRTVLGGGGTEQRGDPIETSASQIVVTGNHITNTNAVVAGFASCRACAFTDNVVAKAPAGVWLQSYVTGNTGCGASPTGCLASTGFTVRGNRFTDLESKVFVVVDAGEEAGLTAADNIYCAAPPDAARFSWLGSELAFAAWAAASGDTSTVVAADDPRCANP
jgi:hypothetical protein